MADVPPPPPVPPPGNSISILGDSIPSAPSINSLSSTQSQSASSLPSTNGPESNAASSTQSKPGKRPATMDELRQSARSWSLAGDAGVLLYFRQFSQNMLRKTHELETAVDKLAFETKGLDSKVHNTFNDFLMLSNKQFIENRVYDEEVAQEEAGEKENSQPHNKTREQLESEILPRFSEAVNLGLQVLEDAFITVELKPDEESDDEDEESLPAGYVPDPIIEPKDMYASRPLPYLIGTAEFFHDETLGLIEVDDEEEETKKQAKDDGDDEDEESETESEESEESETETETESSESSDEEIKKPKKKQVLDDSGSEEETDSDGDLFGETKKKVDISDEESDDEEVKQPKPKMDIQAELAAKLGIPGQMPAVKISEDKDDKSDTQSVTSRKSAGDTQSLASAAETASIASASKGKKEKKHRSRTKSIESHKKHRSSTHEHKHHKHHHQQQQQEEESDEDLFGESKSKGKFEDDSPFGKKGGMFSGGGTLFDDDGEGGLFGDSETAKEPVEAIEKPAEPETPTEIKPRTRTTSTGKKIPAGAVSLFGDTNLFGPSPSKENTIKEEVPKQKPTKTQEEAKKPPPIVKGLFSDDEEDELFAAKPKQDTLKEPPKQKRKKTLELFDDNEDSLFGAKETSPVTTKPTPTVNKSATGQPETANETAKAKATDGLFSGDDSIPSQAKTKPAAKKADSKPKVLSLFDDEDAEEQDWFDNVNPGKSKTPSSKAKETAKPQNPKQDASLVAEPKEVEAKPGAKKEEAKKPSKSRKAVSLFDEDDDDLFGVSSPVNTPSKPAQPDKQKKVEQSKQEAKIEKKPDNLDIKPTVTKKHKAKSFIDNDDSGLFGDEQDDLFTAPSKPQPKKESTASKPKQKSAPSLFLDDEDDLFSTSTKPAKKEEKTKPEKSRSKSKQSTDSIEKAEVKQEKKPEVKQEVKSEDSKKPKEAAKGLLGDEEDGDLFSEKKASPEIKTQEVSKDETQDTEEETATTLKPKKFAGSVSLFGGIDPFAERKNLRSPSKEKVNSPSLDKQTDDDLFVKKPASNDTAPVSIESKTPDDQPVSVQQTKPKITFNPATMLPGASPPKRVIEAAPTSLDDPPAVQTLANPNKDRARIQKKRRPPSRQLRQSTIDILDQLTTGAIPESIIETLNPDSVPSKEQPVTKPKEEPKLVFNDLDKTFEKLPKVTKETEKTMKATNIFSDEDDFFSSKPILAKNTPKASSEKAKEFPKTVVDSVQETPKTITEKATNENTNVSAKTKTKNDDLFDDKLDGEKLSKSIEQEKPKKVRDIDLFFGDKKPSDDIFNTKADSSGNIDKSESNANTSNTSTNNSALTENENFASSDELTKQTRKDSEDEDLFGVSTPAKVDVKKEMVEDKMATNDVSISGEDLGATKEKESGKMKKKKENASIFDAGVDNDLFGGESKKKGDKKEAAKKTKKSTKPVTDDDLFGDSGSIFDDIPSKSKEKKKKKADNGKDIFAKNDSDIFATGGEKKTKTKKKTEKATKPKAAKTQVKDESAPNIFDDPLNALGGD